MNPNQGGKGSAARRQVDGPVVARLRWRPWRCPPGLGLDRAVNCAAGPGGGAAGTESGPRLQGLVAASGRGSGLRRGRAGAGRAPTRPCHRLVVCRHGPGRRRPQLCLRVCDAGLGDRARVLPAGSWLAWVAYWTWSLNLPALALLLLLFPDGQVPSPRWRVVPWLLGVAIAGVTVWSMLQPGPIVLSVVRIANPAGVADLDDPVIQAIGRVPELLAFLTLFVGSVACAMAPFVQHRRAGPIERRQLKWLASRPRPAGWPAPPGSCWRDPATAPWPSLASCCPACPYGRRHRDPGGRGVRHPPVSAV